MADRLMICEDKLGPAHDANVRCEAKLSEFTDWHELALKYRWDGKAKPPHVGIGPIEKSPSAP